MPLGLQFASWYEYYDALPASSVVNKGKMEQMLKSFDASLSADEAKAAMTRNQDFVFLARTGLNKTLGLFHHLEVSGGTILDPEEDCAFFVGLNQANVSSAFSSGSCLANENADEIMRVISSAFYKVVWQIQMLTRFT